MTTEVCRCSVNYGGVPNCPFHPALPAKGLESINFQIDNYDDRQNMIRALANAGYKVWCEEKPLTMGKDYFVCVGTK